jgi:ATP-dependent DNA helicase UvrD/PcrA
MTHTVIYGPPGTGKTRTVIQMVQEHLKEAPGNRALFCSHTKAAAQTAVQRWGTTSGRMEISTIHSHCFRELGLSMAQTVDDAKLKHFVSQFGMDIDDGSEARLYLECIDMATGAGTSFTEAYDKSTRPGTLGHFLSFARSYTAWKEQFGYVDFTDMLVRYPARISRRMGYSLLAIDEAQDLTPAHWNVVYHFMKMNPKCDVVVAGDDDQCIYGYTGAVALGALQFAEKTNAQPRVLGQSFRVPRAVHRTASAIVERIVHRVPKDYLPREAEGLVQGWGDFQWGHSAGRADRDTLILYSDKFIRRELVEPELMDRGVAYTALGGFPAPLDTRVGKALRLAHRGDSLTDEEAGVVRRGLSEHGRTAFDHVGCEPILDKIRKLNFNILDKVHWSHEDYFRRLNWTRLHKEGVQVKISTIHGAKGGEAQDVHLVTARSQAQINQTVVDPDVQHRLFYVGVTRAIERLFLYGGNNSYEI